MTTVDATLPWTRTDDADSWLAERRTYPAHWSKRGTCLSKAVEVEILGIDVMHLEPVQELIREIDSLK